MSLTITRPAQVIKASANLFRSDNGIISIDDFNKLLHYIDKIQTETGIIISVGGFELVGDRI